MPGRAAAITGERCFAYCGADGALQFGPTIPRGMLPVVKACPNIDKVDEWKTFVKGLCRRSYAGNPLVPGIPEAENEQKAMEALEKFRETFQPVIDKEFA